MVAVLENNEAFAAVVAMLRLLCIRVDGNFWLGRRSEKLEKVRMD